MLRLIMIVVWMAVGMLVGTLLTVGSLFVYAYGLRNYGWPPLARVLPNWMGIEIIFFGLIGGGILAATAAMTTLAVLGKLPGTRTAPKKPLPGFAV